MLYWWGRSNRRRIFEFLERSGPLSVAEPPAGTGRYSTQVTANLWTSAQVDSMAGWLLHMGTVNQPRFPVIKVNMARSEVSGGPFFPLQETLDVGAFLDIASPPAWLPPGDIKQIISGCQREARRVHL